MRAPLPGQLLITQPYGGNRNGEARWVPYGDGRIWVRGHTGIDWNCALNTPVYAVWPGIVSHGYEEGGFGNYLVLTVADGRTALYGHLSAYSVPEGRVVGAGQQIALSGSTGNSSGPHLHLEVKPAHPDVLNGWRGCVDYLAGFDHDIVDRLDVSLF